MVKLKVSQVLNFLEKQQRVQDRFICINVQHVLESMGHNLIQRYRLGWDGGAQISTIIARQMREMLPDHILARVPSCSYIDEWFLQSSTFAKGAYMGKTLRIKVLEEILLRNPDACFTFDEKMFKKKKS